MTTDQSQAAEQDGQAPADPPGREPAELADRLMGAVAIAAAAGLLLIGLDMLTGGAVLPAMARAFGGGADDSG